MLISLSLISTLLLLIKSNPLPTTSTPTQSTLKLIKSNNNNNNNNLKQQLSSCSQYHGKSTGLDPFYFIHYPAGCKIEESYDGDSLTIPFDWNEGRLILIVDSSLDLESSIKLKERKLELDTKRMILEMENSAYDQQSQQTFKSNSIEPKLILKLNENESLYQFNSDQQLSDYTSNELNSYKELVVISSDSLPLPQSFSSIATTTTTTSTVDERSVKRIVDHLKSLRFSSLIATIINSLPSDQFVKDVERLTGENPGTLESENWISRHSMSSGGVLASNWVLKQLQSYGLNCTQVHYLPSFSPLVQCIIEGTDPESGTVVLGAHQDSRGTFGTGKAPGGDDDASGSALLLSVARHIMFHKLTFKRKIIIAAFTGEEQGLLGSHYLAKTLREANEDVVLMIQADMVGYRKPGEPLQIAFPDLIGLDEARYLMGNISTIYTPELVVGTTPACCSDHQSFESVGYASTWVFERNNPIADPFYHNSGDISRRDGYDYEQIKLISKVVLATVLEVGGFSI